MKIFWIIALSLFGRESFAQDADTIINKTAYAGTEFTLTAPQLYYTNYQWILPDGSVSEGNSLTTVMHTPGIQPIQCIARDACIDNVALFYVNVVTAVKPTLYRTIIERPGILLYPVPVNEVLQIDNQLPDATLLQITDLTGKILLQQNLENGHSAISLQQLSPGIYLYRTTDGKTHKQRGKLIKQ